MPCAAADPTGGRSPLPSRLQCMYLFDALGGTLPRTPMLKQLEDARDCGSRRCGAFSSFKNRDVTLLKRVMLTAYARAAKATELEASAVSV